MMSDNQIRDERLEREMGDQDDPTLTTRVSRPGCVAEESKPAETALAEAPAATGGIVQQIWRRIKEERNRPKRVEINTRGQNNMDRSKAFLVLGTAVVLCGFAFLALFSRVDGGVPGGRRWLRWADGSDRSECSTAGKDRIECRTRR